MQNTCVQCCECAYITTQTAVPDSESFRSFLYRIGMSDTVYIHSTRLSHFKSFSMWPEILPSYVSVSHNALLQGPLFKDIFGHSLHDYFHSVAANTFITGTESVTVRRHCRVCTVVPRSLFVSRGCILQPGSFTCFQYWLLGTLRGVKALFLPEKLPFMGSTLLSISKEQQNWHTHELWTGTSFVQCAKTSWF